MPEIIYSKVRIESHCFASLFVRSTAESQESPRELALLIGVGYCSAPDIRQGPSDVRVTNSGGGLKRKQA